VFGDTVGGHEGMKLEEFMEMVNLEVIDLEAHN